MRKSCKMFIAFCLLATYIPFLCFASEVNNTQTPAETTEVNYAVTNGSHSLDAVNALLGTDKIVDNARSAIVYDINSQTLMHAWNADTQMYPASFVKILTALIAAEKGTLSDLVTVSEGAIASVPYDAVSASLVAGEVLTLEDLLYCLIVGSANDAAAVIAEFLCGTEQAFVDEMNRYASNIGCTATRFTNAHGLHDDNQHTTARDSAKILSAAMKNEIFRTIFTAKEYTVPATNKSESRRLESGNFMLDSTSKLYYDERIIGGRTGVTQDGRRCLASAAEGNGMLLVCIVMGAESVYQEDGYSAISIGGYKETSSLLDACLNGYKTVQVLHSNQVMRQVAVDGGNNDVIMGTDVSVSAVLPHEALSTDLVYSYSDELLHAPIKKGQLVSNVQIWLNGVCVAQTALYAMNTVSSNLPASNLDEDSTQFDYPIIKWLIIIVIFASVIVLLFKFAVRIKRILTNQKSKRYRRGRRRSR